MFTYGDYQPLEIIGAHRDHVIAFARRRGRQAVITAVAKSFAPFSQGGREWPRAEAFEGSLKLADYSVESIDRQIRTGEMPLSTLFRHLPVAALKAKVGGALKPRRKRNSA